MTLTYRDKLIIFHDCFVIYVMEEIDRQQKASAGMVVPVIQSRAEKILYHASQLPILNIPAATSSIAYQIFSLTYEGVTRTSEVFNFSNNHLVEKMLSDAIKEVSIQFKPTLDKASESDKIREYSAQAALKLFKAISSNAASNTVSQTLLGVERAVELTVEFIVNSVLSSPLLSLLSDAFSNLPARVLDDATRASELDIGDDSQVAQIGRLKATLVSYGERLRKVEERLDRHEEVIRRVEAN